MRKNISLFKRLCSILFVRDMRQSFFRYNRALIRTIFKGDYEKAIEDYQYILKKGALICPESLIYKNLGVVYVWNGNFHEAEIALRKSLELSIKEKHRDSELYEYLGYVSCKKGEFKEGLFFYEKAAKFGKKDVLNKMMTNMDHVREMNKFLKDNEDILPFMSAYYKQNKKRFLTNTNSKK